MYFFSNEEDDKFERYRTKTITHLEEENEALKAQLRLCQMSFKEQSEYLNWENEYLKKTDLSRYEMLENVFQIYEDTLANIVPFIWASYKETFYFKSEPFRSKTATYPDGLPVWTVEDGSKTLELPKFVSYSLESKNLYETALNKPDITSFDATYLKSLENIKNVLSHAHHMKINLHSRIELALRHILLGFKQTNVEGYRPRLYPGSLARFVKYVTEHYGPFSPEKKYNLRIDKYYFLNLEKETLFSKIITPFLALEYASRFYLNPAFDAFRKAVLKIKDILPEETVEIEEVEEELPKKLKLITSVPPVISGLIFDEVPKFDATLTDKQHSALREHFPGLTKERFASIYYLVYTTRTALRKDAETNTGTDVADNKFLTEEEKEDAEAEKKREITNKLRRLESAQSDINLKHDMIKKLHQTLRTDVSKLTIKDKNLSAIFTRLVGMDDIMNYKQILEKDEKLEKDLSDAMKEIKQLREENIKIKGTSNYFEGFVSKLNILLTETFNSKVDLRDMPNEEFLSRLFEDKLAGDTMILKNKINFLENSLLELRTNTELERKKANQEILNAALLSKPLEALYANFQQKMSNSLSDFTNKLDSTKHKVDSIVSQLPEYIDKRVEIETRRTLPKIVDKMNETEFIFKRNEKVEVVNKKEIDDRVSGQTKNVGDQKNKNSNTTLIKIAGDEENENVNTKLIKIARDKKNKNLNMKLIKIVGDKENKVVDTTIINNENNYIEWKKTLENSIYFKYIEIWRDLEFLNPSKAMPYNDAMTQDQWSWQKNRNQELGAPKFTKMVTKTGKN
jgi:hypothetical protein